MDELDELDESGPRSPPVGLLASTGPSSGCWFVYLCTVSWPVSSADRASACSSVTSSSPSLVSNVARNCSIASLSADAVSSVRRSVSRIASRIPRWCASG